MRCPDIQETILESFEVRIAPDDREQVEGHLLTCDDCARFAAIQRKIDARLQEAFCAPALSPDFARTLGGRIKRYRREESITGLPDLVYFVGAAFAILSCAVLLPTSTSVVLPAGIFLALSGYVLEAILFGMFEEPLW
jgi:anti-sigma factor RsiW